MVQVQTILFASLAASLFSAFLAMLGKQWLNRYALVDMRGSAIERSQNRQRKLNGIISWYFDYAMESLPLMLQAALLLLGCALSRYLWGINRTVASVIIGVTSFGVLLYIFIVVAGAIFVSCPYQTPGANILRRIPHIILHILHHIPRIIPYIIRLIPHIIPFIFHHILNIFHAICHIPYIPGVLYSFFSASIRKSFCYIIITAVWHIMRIRASGWPTFTVVSLLFHTLILPVWLAMDVCKATIWLLVAFPCWVYSQLQQRLEQQTAALDMHCISWALRTSLDGPVHILTLDYLTTTILPHFDTTLLVDCFDVLFGCIKATNGRATLTQGMEQVATRSSLCCLHVLSHLPVIGPTPRVFENICHRYTRNFPFETKFDDLPFSHTLGVIHNVFYPNKKSPWSEERLCRWKVKWEDCNLSSNEHIIVAHALIKLARFEYKRNQYKKVPRWLLQFALQSLSQSPLPPTSVVVNCLSIITIDMGCDFTTTITSDERCVYTCQISTSLTKN